MDDFKRIEFKIDRIDQRINNIDVTLASQHESLKDHIRRTELLEDQIKPIQKKINYAEGALKLIGFVATIAGIIEVILLAVKK